MVRQNYRHTIYASYIGYIAQAIVNNLAPLLFLTFQTEYDISIEKISLLITVNFGIQLLVDVLSARYVDRIGYRAAIMAAHFFCAAGLIGLGTFPEILPDPYMGLVLAVGLYAVGGGLIEVLISPIVEACPTDDKSGNMSLLHSFYCWGQVGVVLLSTLYFQFAGIENWRILALLWALVPIVNFFYFSRVPINHLVEEGQAMPVKKMAGMKIFWIFIVMMVCAGAAEQAMSQWASAFAELGLGVNKTVGDLLGPCMFAALMGCSRVFYGKFSGRINLSGFISGSAVLCVCSYLLAVFAPIPLLSLAGCALTGLAVGIMWPGTFSLAAERCPQGGTAMFAFFALAGDLGCSSGPGLVGVMSGAFGGQLKMGLLFAIVFPILMLIGVGAMKKAQE
ncbi:MAG: MFS transporter [Clostridiales bacterium]|nr:MFS transporter [Clostridiales bacterium]